MVLAGIVAAGSWLALKQVTGDGPPAPGAAEKQALISRQHGGVIAFADGTGVRIPPGALPADTTVTLRRLTNPTRGGRAVTLTRVDVGGVTLASPATLRLPCPPLPAGKEGPFQVQVYRIHDGQRTPMPCLYDPYRRVVEVRTRQFSDWEASLKDQQPTPKGITDRARRDYRTFFGLDDTRFTPETQAGRYVAMRDGLGDVILDYQKRGQLDTKDPTAGRMGAFGHTLAALNGAGAAASILGADLGTLLRDQGPPDDIAAQGNYYARFTRVSERELRQKVLASGGNLTPADVMKMALEATNGNYPAAMLTAHNFLKNVAYKGRGSTSGVGMLMPTGGEEYIVDVASRLVNLRGDPGKADKLGPWYHMFGILFLGSVTSEKMARDGTHFEQCLRWWKNHVWGQKDYSPVDPEKAEWDRVALLVMQRVYPHIYGGRPVPESGEAEPVLAAGALRVRVVKVVDEATKEPVSGATVEVTFVGKKESLRTGRTVGGQVVFGSLPGQYGRYQVHVSLQGYAPATEDVELLFEQSATVTVTLKKSAKQVVWVLKDGYPKLNPENKPLEWVVTKIDAGKYGNLKHTDRTILTNAGRIAFRSDYVDNRGSTKKEFHYRWDFTIRFQGTATGVAPRVLEPHKRYAVEVAADWNEKIKKLEDPKYDTFPPGYRALLAVRLNGLEFPLKDRTLPEQTNQQWPERLLLVGNWPERYSPDHVKTTCGFRLTAAARDEVVLDFLMRDRDKPPLVRYVYERKEVTPEELDALLRK
jgi:hypothetical protein